MRSYDKTAYAILNRLPECNQYWRKEKYFSAKYLDFINPLSKIIS